MPTLTNKLVDPVLDIHRALYDHPAIVPIKEKLATESEFVFSDYVPLFKQLLASDLPAKAVGLELARIAQHPYAHLPRYSIQGPVKFWVIAVSKHFTITLAYYDKGDKDRLVLQSPEKRRSTIQAISYDAFIGMLDTDGAICKLYEYPDYDVNAPLPLGTNLTLRKQHDLSRLDHLEIRAHKDVAFFKMKNVSVYIDVSGVPQLQLGAMPQFDAETLRLVGWVSGDSTASRHEFLTKLLAELDCESAIPHILPLTEHVAHNVRWETIKHVLCLNRDVGMGLVRKALTDPHLHVRQAAHATLMKFDHEYAQQASGK